MEFHQLLSPYLRKLMDDVKKNYGEDSKQYKALYYQYVFSDEEKKITRESNNKHYEAVVEADSSALCLVERLYKRQATVDLTKACSAHCRYCLRQNYSNFSYDDDIEKGITNYLKNDQYLKEILITGGDPLLDSEKLIHLMTAIIKNAPNIKVIRIGTRLPVQNPAYLNTKLLDFFVEQKANVQIEIAIQINHAIEYQAETESCIKDLQHCGTRIYAQNVLLRNVNDDIDTLVDLYDLLRYQGIEAHYLFHPVPIKRTAHFRMPVHEFLYFAKELTASGEIPGRSKPMFSLMTDIGKVTLYQGTLSERDNDGYYLVNTGYRLEDRRKWNANYQLPSSAVVDNEGKILVKYMDGCAERV